jgi:predicted nucleic acid-binding protein
LLDDARGRGEARRRHLTVTGTLGVLRTAAQRGLIDVREVLARLRATSFYVNDAVVQEVFNNWLTKP